MKDKSSESLVFGVTYAEEDHPQFQEENGVLYEFSKHHKGSGVSTSVSASDMDS